MKVKEVLKSASVMIGREDVAKYLEDDSVEVGVNTLPTVNVLVSLLNLVVGELAGTFIPMIKREKVKAVGGKIYYAALSERCVKVVGTYLLDGSQTDYDFTPEFMRVYADEILVEYEYIPPNYDLAGDIGYTEKEITASTLAYGLCAEYCISQGDFDQAVMWHERYVDSISCHRKLKNSSVRERSFV